MGPSLEVLGFLQDPNQIVNQELLTFRALKAEFTRAEDGSIKVTTYCRNPNGHRLAGITYVASTLLDVDGYKANGPWEYAHDRETYVTTLTRGNFSFVRKVQYHGGELLLGSQKIHDLVLQKGLKACDCSSCDPDPRTRFNPENHGFPEDKVWPQTFLFQQVDVCVDEEKGALLVLAPKGNGNFSVAAYSKKSNH